MTFKKIVTSLGLLAIIPVTAFGGLVAYHAFDGSEEAFCRRLLDVEKNQHVLENFKAESVKHYQGNGYRYGQQTRLYVDYQICSTSSSHTDCWNQFNATKPETVLETIELSLAAGAILQDCESTAIRSFRDFFF